MSATLSPNTQAILLLTAPLASASMSERPLSAADYGRLAVHLRSIGKQPADFLDNAADQIDALCGSVIAAVRVRKLLARGFLLSQALERWHNRALWVVSRADSTYPRRLKARLQATAPPVLYGCGDIGLLDRGGLAIVGSRNIDAALMQYTKGVAQLAAGAQQTIISGAARGTDTAAMRGALDAGGRALGVLPDSLEQAALTRDNRDALLARKLTLVSPFDPSAPFSAGQAIARNKLIYALSDAALVVQSDIAKGGTWSGASEQLETLHCVQIYVRAAGHASASEGLAALQKLGADPWPEPATPEALVELLRTSKPQARMDMDMDMDMDKLTQTQLPLAHPKPDTTD